MLDQLWLRNVFGSFDSVIELSTNEINMSSRSKAIILELDDIQIG